MKKSFLLVLSFVLIALIGCGGEKKTTIGVAIETFDDAFMQNVKDAVEVAAEEMGVQVIVVDGKGDPAEQVKQVDNFITNKVDAIVVHVINNDIAPTITQKAVDAGIPLVYMNRRPTADAIPTGKAVASVASPEEKAGEGQAKYVVDALAKKGISSGNAAILYGTLGSAPQIGRSKGVEDYLAKNAPDIKVTRKQTAQWKRPEAVNVVENWLASGDEFVAIFANNDEMALGASLALKEAGLRDKVLVVGVDANPDALVAIENDDLDLSMFQNGRAQGTGSVETAIKMINGESYSQNVLIPFEAVSKENVSQYK